MERLNAPLHLMFQQRESNARKEIETKLNKCESRAQRAEGEKSDRIKAEEVLLVLSDSTYFHRASR